MTSRLAENLEVLKAMNPDILNEDARGRLAMLAVAGLRVAQDQRLSEVAAGYRDLASRVDSTFDIAYSTGQL